MPRRLSARTIAVIFLSVCTCISLGYVFGLRRTTIKDMGSWMNVKGTMEYWLCDVQGYTDSTQALSSGALNLGAWHGYQQIVLEHGIPATSYSFRFRLAQGTYVTTLFNENEGTYRFIRIGSDTQTPTAVGVVDGNGKFMRYEPHPNVTATPGTWHSLQVEFDRDGYSVSVDGTRAWHTSDTIQPVQRIGFRGALNPVYVDDVVIKSGPNVVFRDGFYNTRAFFLGIGMVAAMLVVIYGGVAVLSVISRRRDRLMKYLLVTATTIAVCSIPVVVTAPVYFSRYPRAENLDGGPPVSFEESAGGQLKSIDQSFGELKRGTSSAVIVFAGGSQTHGTGASDTGHTWVDRVGKIFAATYPSRHILTVNSGIEGASAFELRQTYERHWLKNSPTALVLNTSSNDAFWDISLDEFTGALEDFYRLSGSATPSVSLVFSLEANSPENNKVRLYKRHAIITQVAQKYGIPLLNPGPFLDSHRNDGFLWWDYVHLTNYGQRLMAEYMAREVPKALGWQ